MQRSLLRSQSLRPRWRWRRRRPPRCMSLTPQRASLRRLSPLLGRTGPKRREHEPAANRVERTSGIVPPRQCRRLRTSEANGGEKCVHGVFQWDCGARGLGAHGSRRASDQKRSECTCTAAPEGVGSCVRLQLRWRQISREGVIFGAPVRVRSVRETVRSSSASWCVSGRYVKREADRVEVSG